MLKYITTFSCGFASFTTAFLRPDFLIFLVLAVQMIGQQILRNLSFPLVTITE